MLKIIFPMIFKESDYKKGVFMGKSKTLGFQIHSALSEINLQDKEKRIEIFNRENSTHFDNVGKRAFKQNGTSINYIFSKRSAENITEKAKNFVKFLKDNYGIKMVRDITPQMCIEYLNTKSGCSTKTVSAYKNMLEKVAFACSQKFKCDNFYSNEVRHYKVSDTYKTDSKRIYTNEQIEKIYNYKGSRQAEIKTMAFLGCRVSELINIKVSDINLSKHTFATTVKDGRIDTFSSVHIKGKGGKDSYRVILPQYREFFKDLISGKGENERLFDLPTDTKKARLEMSNEIRRITKSLDIPQSGKNHEFRKYHCQLALNHYISKGWDREKAEKFVIQRHLSHSGERQDLKRIYLYS